MIDYSEFVALTIELLEEFGKIIQIGNPARNKLAVRLSTENHFIETGGLNSAFGMAKVPNGDHKFVFEPSANPLLNESFISATNDRFIVSQVEPIAPANIVVAWIVLARNA